MSGDHTHDGTSAVPDDYEKKPETSKEWYKFWQGEFSAADKMLRKFHKNGHKVVDTYLDERKTAPGDDTGQAGSRLNLFHSDIKTLEGLLYGQVPKIDVSRQNSDPEDDVARVASLILGRILNKCVADPGDDYRTLLKSALQDRLLPGLGCGRVRYTYESDTQQIPAMMSTPVMGEEPYEMAPGYEEEILIDEDSPTVYTHWTDVKWSYARTWSELRWVAFRSYMGKEEVTERWSEEDAEKMTFKNSVPRDTKDNDGAGNSDFSNPMPQAEVWEIWNKTDGTVHWYAEGMDKELEQMEDPLEMDGFFPCPPFIAANITTTLYMPKADYLLAQDLYMEVDELTTRIQIITEAVKVVGVYDETATGVERIFSEGVENDLIPVPNWAAFAEKGGLAGSIAWLPLADVINTLDKLREIRVETIGLLHEVTGMSDIMRGQSEQYTSASTDKLKVKFGSARTQNLQMEFAEFATNLMKMKAEVIARHFEPDTILKQANMSTSNEDPQLIQAAIQLIKDPSMLEWRIQVRPESIAMIDYSELQAERTEYLTAVATFMQSSAPMIESMPGAAPFLMELLKWGLAGFKGSQELEGIMDKALDSAQKAQKEGGDEKPDPALEKGKQEMEKIQLSMEQDKQKHQFKMTEMNADHQADMKEIMAQLQAKLKEIAAESDSDLRLEMAQAEFNIAELETKDTLDHKDHIRDMEMQGAKVDTGSSNS